MWRSVFLAWLFGDSVDDVSPWVHAFNWVGSKKSSSTILADPRSSTWWNCSTKQTARWRTHSREPSDGDA